MIDSVSVKGMKKADFIQLQDMFKEIYDSGMYWGNHKYWQQSNIRLIKWLHEINEQLKEEEIKQ